jgi:hypothetical protein
MHAPISLHEKDGNGLGQTAAPLAESESFYGPVCKKAGRTRRAFDTLGGSDPGRYDSLGGPDAGSFDALGGADPGR